MIELCKTDYRVQKPEDPIYVGAGVYAWPIDDRMRQEFLAWVESLKRMKELADQK